MHGYVSLLSVLVLAWCLAVRTDLSECSERVNFFEIHVCVQTFHVTVHRNSFKFVLYSRKSKHFFFLSLVECYTILYRSIFTS